MHGDLNCDKIMAFGIICILGCSGLCRQVVLIVESIISLGWSVDQPTMVFVDRWSFYAGGVCIQVVLVYRWSLYTGGPCMQAVFVYRWSLYTGGPCIQVVLVYRGSLYTGDPCIQVDCFRQISIMISRNSINSA